MAHGPKSMTWIPGGEFHLGSNDSYPEERFVHEVAADGFWMMSSRYARGVPPIS
jgi:formylglycine-generating enzyme required for sulfatase activity